jgi:hypothetical protein
MTEQNEPQIEQREAQPYVAMPAHVTSEAEFRRAADSGFPEPFGWLQQRGVVPAEPVFIRYLVTDEGSKLRGSVEHFRIGPAEESDYSKWETELAYLTST